ncbi:MAG TPA: hypothetical protein EYQ31_11590 [Candidatus Handelsmanbacteria bacterium]|nr:hypothetical protein [Candidatus Handelsmanbacteria bacterium]
MAALGEWSHVDIHRRVQLDGLQPGGGQGRIQADCLLDRLHPVHAALSDDESLHLSGHGDGESQRHNEQHTNRVR